MRDRPFSLARLFYQPSNSHQRRGWRLPLLVKYDIPDDKRRTKVHQILLGYGTWTQYSLFECFLTKKELILLQARLTEYLVAKEDSVRFYPLCANCVSRVQTVGDPPPREAQVFIV